MNNHNKSNFDKMAATWDERPQPVKLAAEISDAIIREIQPTREMDVLDFGCGSGLVTLSLQPYVKSITGIDNSQGMLEVLQGKIKKLELQNVRTRFADIERGENVEGKYHLVVSSMAFHHVNKVDLLLERLYDLLLPDGFIAIADLDKEDGSFHNDNTGVVHFGFDRKVLKAYFEQAGFREVRDTTAATVIKEIEGKGIREFPVFLITGRK